MNEIDKHIQENIKKYNEKLSDFISSFMLSFKDSLSFYDTDDFEERVKKSFQISRSFDKQNDFVKIFSVYFEDGLKKSYVRGVNKASEETREYYQRMSWLDDMDMLRIKTLAEKQKVVLKRLSMDIKDHIHDLTIDYIMSGYPVEGIYSIFNSESFLVKYMKLREVIGDFIFFSLKETFNIAKIYMFKQVAAEFYSIKQIEKEHDGCDRDFSTLALPLSVPEVIFPPFHPKCTCETIIDKQSITTHKVLQQQKTKGATTS